MSQRESKNCKVGCEQRVSLEKWHANAQFYPLALLILSREVPLALSVPMTVTEQRAHSCVPSEGVARSLGSGQAVGVV